jgi:hypothetical protein
MFRTTDVFHPGAWFAGEADWTSASNGAPVRVDFESEREIGTLMPVYSEIARRLSRNAYTSHGAR